ncbi:unnamed protein product [Linum tenue]|uniref:Uncharacterized protein n=1 Tax=Linum tenue TaxID=586396 RepID=A0AAV0N7W0_9ROSI|nr:unnamed protein product [Linum tenue]
MVATSRTPLPTQNLSTASNFNPEIRSHPMSTFVASGGNGAGAISAATSVQRHKSSNYFPHRGGVRLPLPLSPRRSHLLHIVSAKGRRGSIKTTEKLGEKRNTTSDPVEFGSSPDGVESSAGLSNSSVVDDGFVMPKLPGDEKDFWEGPQWDTLGFAVEYLWALGIVFSLIACGVAVATYNEGATDFKDTPAYKESTQTGDVLEEPGESVFESNPTEEAPSLD